MFLNNMRKKEIKATLEELKTGLITVNEAMEQIMLLDSALLSELIKEQQEIISSPIRFNGVHIEKIKQIFQNNGIKYDIKF